MSLAALLTSVRYYTQADPYYYTVDNRPLEDLKTRDDEIANDLDKRVNVMRIVGTATPSITAGPAGWTIVSTGTGDYTITHSLGTLSFAVVAGATGGPGFVTVFSQSSTEIRIKTFNTAGAAAHISFTLLVSQYA
jgi:hypothetical protein